MATYTAYIITTDGCKCPHEYQNIFGWHLLTIISMTEYVVYGPYDEKQLMMIPGVITVEGPLLSR